MTGVAFTLVLASAFAHATWNFLLKRSEYKVAFLWALFSFSFVVFMLPAAVFAYTDGLGWRGLLFGVVSALLHGAYGLALARGYQIGDLSVVYPIARGMAPALIPIIAVVLFDEAVSGWGWLGIAFVVTGILVVQFQSLHPRDLARPLRNMGGRAAAVALLTGALITTYTLWDKEALVHLAPVTLNQFSMSGYVLLLPFLVFRQQALSVRTEWRERRVSIIAAGILAPLGYLLVLIALTTSKVSYVAPAREVGIVIGALLGVVMLHEGYGRTRIVGSVLIVAGAMTLGLAP
jgi:drug/metabolite transporter (DMT)-like permease